MSLLAQISIFLAAAVIAIPIFRRFKLGAVLGYLTAGIIIGPSSLGLISTVDTAENIAQFGIVLLMFVIGLELQPSRLWVLRKSIFGLGAAQVAATTLCLGAAAYIIFAQSWQSALVIGFALSMSSTALALQLLAERGQLNSQFGRAAFSILLFQDISVLPVLALLPLLGRERRENRRLGRLAGGQIHRACSRRSSSAAAMFCVRCCASSPQHALPRRSRRRVC